MIVRILPDAEADIEAIGDFSPSDNPRRAVSFIDELRKACGDLRDMPEAFPVVP